jgi:hypothetical protein
MLEFICDCQRNVNVKSEQNEVISVNLSQKLIVPFQTRLKQLQNDIASLAEHEERLSEIQNQQLIQILQKKVELGIEQLDLQAEHINSLALQLEVEMLNFQKIVAAINPALRQLRYLNNKSRKQPILSWTPPLSIWQIHSSIVPIVVKQRGVFILAAKTVDFFQKDCQRRAELAQRRRQKFENWLLQQRRF